MYNKEYYQKNSLYILEYQKQYKIKYPCKKVLNTIKQRCSNIKNASYKNYGGRGIKCLIIENELKELWFRDKAYLMKRPSIDRKDNDGNYTLENCQFIEFKENYRKDKCKIILQFTKDNVFIKEWPSSRNVEKNLKISQPNIGKCLNGLRKTAGGFKWYLKTSII